MKRLTTRSLRSRLTLRMVAIVAAAIAVSCLLPVAVFTSLDRHQSVIPDPRDPIVVRDAVSVTTNGQLQLVATESLNKLWHETPDVWIFVHDDNGRSLFQHGPNDVVINEDAIAAADAVMRAVLTDGYVPMQSQLVDTGHGQLNIVVGQGRQLPIWQALTMATNNLALLVFIVISAALIITIPWMIRHEMRGLELSAKQADSIDANKRGARLTNVGLPSEVIPLVDAINAALERLDEGHSRQQRFLAAAAHELKTPIAILQTRVETTIEGKARGALLLDLARLNTLADQLLDLQRFENDVALFDRFDFTALCQQVAADFAPLALSSGYALEFDSALEQFIVAGDRASMERAVTNLVQNAMAHGGHHGTIGLQIDIDGALVVVDQGPGIAEDMQDRVFEPFVRAGGHGPGAGLGLSLVRDIVNRHGGHVTVSNAPSGGAAFRIALPASPAPAKASQARSA